MYSGGQLVIDSTIGPHAGMCTDHLENIVLLDTIRLSRAFDQLGKWVVIGFSGLLLGLIPNNCIAQASGPDKTTSTSPPIILPSHMPGAAATEAAPAIPLARPANQAPLSTMSPNTKPNATMTTSANGWAAAGGGSVPNHPPVLPATAPPWARPSAGPGIPPAPMSLSAPLPMSAPATAHLPPGLPAHSVPGQTSTLLSPTTELSAPPPLLGMTPALTPEAKEKQEKYIRRFMDPEATLDLILGRTRGLQLNTPPTRVQIGDETIAAFNLVNPQELLIQGNAVGSTVLNLWFPSEADPNQEDTLSFLVRVLPDPEAKARLERVYDQLEAEINRAYPESLVDLFLVGEKLAVSGVAKDFVEATQIMQIVRSNAPNRDQANAADIPIEQNIVDPANLGPDGQPKQALENFLAAGGPNVINLLRIPGEQQVMLKVMVAEVNRSAARSIGINFSIFTDNGVPVFSSNTGNLLSSILRGGAGVGALGAGGIGGNFLSGGGGGGGGTGLVNLPVILDNGQFILAINALRRLNYARTLAEPNLVTINGQPATFQAGGQFPVPVVSGLTFNGLQGVQFIPFGVQLNFTPYITDRDRIRLDVAAEVSSRDLSSGQTNIGGSQISNLITRNFQTTVELRSGQTLAVAGLIQNNLGAESSRIPFFGDLPVIGRFGSFDQITAGEQELVILITPELVHPMECDEIPPLPGSDIFEPNDIEFYLLGRLESHLPMDFRSPIRTDWSRLKQYRETERLYLMGPHGHVGKP